MKKLRLKIHHLTWILSFAILIIGCLSNRTLDLNIGDTYYVFTYSNLSIFASLILALEGFIYWLLSKYFNFLILLSVVHLLLYFIGFLSFNNFDLINSSKIFYTNSNFPNENWWEQFNLIMLSQIAFLINLFFGIATKFLNKVKP